MGEIGLVILAIVAAIVVFGAWAWFSMTAEAKRAAQEKDPDEPGQAPKA